MDEDEVGVTCPACHGRGARGGPCLLCNDAGEVSREVAEEWDASEAIDRADERRKYGRED